MIGMFNFSETHISIARSKPTLEICSLYLLTLSFTQRVDTRHLENNEQIQESTEKIHEDEE